MEEKKILDGGKKQNTVQWCTRSDISPLRYPGGKRKLAPLVADLIARTGVVPELFIEAFAGGASVSISLLEAGLVKKIGLCDADPLVASFWKVVFSSEAQALADRIYDNPITLEEWLRLRGATPSTPLEAAFKCLFLNRTSFSGSLHPATGPIGGKSQSGSYLIDCRFNRTRLAERVLELSALRGRVAFVNNESYLKTLARIRKSKLGKQSSDQIAWYLDPPFFEKADKLYPMSFDAVDHDRLAAEVSRIPGRWILSYDDHAEARRLYGSHPGFARVNLQYSARIDGRERLVATEVIVSDIIGNLRASGVLRDEAEIIQLPSRRQQIPTSIYRETTEARAVAG